MLRLEASSVEIRAWASQSSEADDDADAFRVLSSDSREVRDRSKGKGS